MKLLLNYSIFIVCALILSCKNTAQSNSNNKTYIVSKTSEEWKKVLTSEQYYVMRESGTERAFSSELNKNYGMGIYSCVACKTPLFESEHKYNSGTGWPSFDKAIKKNIELDEDYKIGYKRIEIKCNTCGSHLGHLFDDGPPNTTGKRYCINGIALLFFPNK